MKDVLNRSKGLATESKALVDEALRRDGLNA